MCENETSGNKYLCHLRFFWKDLRVCKSECIWIQGRKLKIDTLMRWENIALPVNFAAIQDTPQPSLGSSVFRANCGLDLKLVTERCVSSWYHDRTCISQKLKCIENVKWFYARKSLQNKAIFHHMSSWSESFWSTGTKNRKNDIFWITRSL